MFGSTRRRILLDAGAGFGWLAFRSLAQAAPHFAPRAKRVIQLFCAGGMSHLDTFDHKPELARRDGKPYDMPTFFGQGGSLFACPWEFRRRGQSGLWVSGLLPNLATVADKLTVVRSMTAKSANHMPAIAQMNTGFILTGFPSMGAWVLYGLGSESANLPAFVVLPDHRGAPWGGSVHWTNSFLPASFQGTAFRATGDPVPDLSTPKDLKPESRADALAWLARMNAHYADSNPGDSALDARLKTYELAARMQLTVPETTDLAGESEATRRLYGIDKKETAEFGKRCLLARRLAEKGVRFVQAYCGGSGANWDSHQNIAANHPKMAIEYDQPAAALLRDLDSRGMLGDTLVMGVTEFGRTPVSQGTGSTRGRDHHPDCFSIWMAGAGLKPGFAWGESDEVGRKPAENPVSVHDLHATALHMLGLDHERLTHYHNGARRRLTDVHGSVVHQLLA
jgi:hypothetical protein